MRSNAIHCDSMAQRRPFLAAIAIGVSVALAFGVACAISSARQRSGAWQRRVSSPAPSTGVRRPVADWPVTGGDPGAARYSPLADIDTTNVRQLRVAWVYRHGDVRSGGILPDRDLKGTAFEATPIVVDGRLIFTTPFNRVVALDPETGRELWTFDPRIDKGRRFANMLINRGVAYWRDTVGHSACVRRVFLGTLDARLIAIDAVTGRPCGDFGSAGTVNLLAGVENVVDTWEYNVTSPPTVVGDVIVVGSSIADITRRIQPSGVVRAFDARSGRLLWRFNTIPKAGEIGNETWQHGGWRTTGSANVWSTITADTARGLVFLPVGAAGPDFYGGDRLGANLFASSVVALEAKTGKYVWHFQAVHHDIWDYDIASPPILVSVRHDARTRDAVVVLTKTGLVFLLDRESGVPLFPVEERPVPRSDVPGEVAWPTQPFPLKPAPLVPLRLTEQDLWGRDAEALARCRRRFRALRHDGVYTPPSERATLIFPGNGGGANWSGGAFDPVSGLIVVPVTNSAHTIRLERLPASNFDRTGGTVMRGGAGALRWLLTGKGTGLRYKMQREWFAEGRVPCNRPPWGMLVAVDLHHGEIRWHAPVGEDERGVRGLPNFGPPLVTGGGVVFHGGSTDRRLRAHHIATGREVASFTLPAGLHAGPVTYRVRPEGKQYLVVAPGGHTILRSKLGDYVIAYTLPDELPTARP
jgi:quinoprotein glucose dehydrogenase